MNRKGGLADSPFFNQNTSVNRSTTDVFSAAVQPTKEQIISPETSPEENTALARNMAIGQAILPERPNAGMPEVGQSGKTESPIARMPEIMNARNMAEGVRAALETKFDKKESFRFPLELIDELIDIRHEVRKTYRKPISKTAVFVAALTAYLRDFREHGKESLLYKHLIEEQS